MGLDLPDLPLNIVDLYRYWTKKGLAGGLTEAANLAAESLTPASRWLTQSELAQATILKLTGSAPPTPEDEILAVRYVDRYRSVAKETSAWTGFVASSGYPQSPDLEQHTTRTRLALAEYADPVARLSDGQSVRLGATPDGREVLGGLATSTVIVIVVIAAASVAIAYSVATVSLAGAERDGKLIGLAEKDLTFRQERMDAASRIVNDAAASPEAKASAQRVLDLLSTSLSMPVKLPTLPAAGLPSLPGGTSTADGSWKFWVAGGLALFLVGRFGGRR
jgi:hypothetical protein